MKTPDEDQLSRRPLSDSELTALLRREFNRLSVEPVSSSEIDELMTRLSLESGQREANHPLKHAPPLTTGLRRNWVPVVALAVVMGGGGGLWFARLKGSTLAPPEKANSSKIPFRPLHYLESRELWVNTDHHTVSVGSLEVTVNRVSVREVDFHNHRDPERSINVQGTLRSLASRPVWMAQVHLQRGGAETPIPRSVDGGVFGIVPPNGMPFSAQAVATDAEMKGRPVQLSLLIPVTDQIVMDRVTIPTGIGSHSALQRTRTADGEKTWQATINANFVVMKIDGQVYRNVVGVQVEEFGSDVWKSHLPMPDLGTPLFNVSPPWRFLKTQWGRSTRPNYRSTTYYVRLIGKKRSNLEVRYLPSGAVIPNMEPVRAVLPVIALSKAKETSRWGFSVPDTYLRKKKAARF